MEISRIRFIKQPVIEPISQAVLARYPSFTRETKMLIFGDVCAVRFYHNVIENMADPKQEKFAMFFAAGKGGKKCGFPPQSECFLIDSKLYRRLSWVDAGRQTSDGHRRANGMKIQIRGKLVYFVVEVEITDEIREAIANAV